MILETIDDLSKLYKDYYMNFNQEKKSQMFRKLFEEKISNRLVKLCVLNNIIYITDFKFIEKIVYDYKIKNIYSTIYLILLNSIEDDILIIYEEPLRKIMDCNDKYKIQHNFVKKIINEPIQQINEKTDMYIDVRSIKKSKKVIAWELKNKKV